MPDPDAQQHRTQLPLSQPDTLATGKRRSKGARHTRFAARDGRGLYMVAGNDKTGWLPKRARMGAAGKNLHSEPRSGGLPCAASMWSKLRWVAGHEVGSPRPCRIAARRAKRKVASAGRSAAATIGVVSYQAGAAHADQERSSVPGRRIGSPTGAGPDRFSGPRYHSRATRWGRLAGAGENIGHLYCAQVWPHLRAYALPVDATQRGPAGSMGGHLGTNAQPGTR